MRADALLEQVVIDVRAVWLRVMAAIKVLEATEPYGTVH